mmetsp:Transcript_4875/g.16051  ORF Transcript_4875/g.16051 Transcript_4875/m.16051 type:complete len:272 (+) Transcript_4875:371-1186(+)
MRVGHCRRRQPDLCLLMHKSLLPLGAERGIPAPAFDRRVRVVEAAHEFTRAAPAAWPWPLDARCWRCRRASAHRRTLLTLPRHPVKCTAQPDSSPPPRRCLQSHRVPQPRPASTHLGPRHSQARAATSDGTRMSLSPTWSPVTAPPIPSSRRSTWVSTPSTSAGSNSRRRGGGARLRRRTRFSRRPFSRCRSACPCSLPHRPWNSRWQQSDGPPRNWSQAPSTTTSASASCCASRWALRSGRSSTSCLRASMKSRRPRTLMRPNGAELWVS